MAPPQLTLAHRIERGSDSTVVLLHATGGDEHQLINIGRELAPTATLLAPRGDVLENGVTRRFFARNSFGLDMDDFVVRTDRLAQFVREATTAYGLDPEQVFSLGYSNGANVAAGLLLRHPSLQLGAVLLRPSVVYDPPDPPDLDGVDVLLEAGSADPYTPSGEHAALADRLRNAGAQVHLIVHSAGHQLTPDDFARAGDWLAKRL